MKEVSGYVVDRLLQLGNIIEDRNTKMIEKLDWFTVDIKYAEAQLKGMEAEEFSYGWDEEILGEYGEVVGHVGGQLRWTGDKILYHFSEDEPSDEGTLLGQSAQIRYMCAHYFDDFLKRGIAAHEFER